MMALKQGGLSPRSSSILELIAQGHVYEQILAIYPALTYLNIFSAAREALDALRDEDSDYAKRLSSIRSAYPRAYETWSEDEDAKLRRLALSGASVSEMSMQLQRQPSAVRSRMSKLGLVDKGGRVGTPAR